MLRIKIEVSKDIWIENGGRIFAESTDERHMIFIERVEDEYYVRIDHCMTNEHSISFVAAASSADMQLVKLYPEGNAKARFKVRRESEGYSFTVIATVCFQSIR